MPTPALALEQHYTVAAIASLWKFSRATVVKLFKDEPGVPKVNASGAGLRMQLRIPETVMKRVHARLEGYNAGNAEPVSTPHAQMPAPRKRKGVAALPVPATRRGDVEGHVSAAISKYTVVGNRRQDRAGNRGRGSAASGGGDRG